MLKPSPLPEVLDKNLRLAIFDALMAARILPRTAKCADCDGAGDYCKCACDCSRGCLCGSADSDDEGDCECTDDCDCDWDSADECDCDCECVDPEDSGYRDGVAKRLLDIPVTADQCLAVRKLVWAAGVNDIVYTIWTDWDGESDEFCIESLEGIAATLPNLESLSIDEGGVSDLTPLAGCTKLRQLRLLGGGVTDLGPLAGLGSLRTLELQNLKALDLRSLTGLPLEHLSLDGDPKADLSPLLDLASLRTLSCRETVYISGSKPSILSKFDNAHVIETLEQRGVAVTVR